ncbi:receptor-like protein EIX2 [Rosa rugosa]|uniref:receptor-like protein EIX2 n=1 Tax=Rosa rugosa TaxID=74645 RepID=UPI002B40CBFD|nr:receptor-like protein EIX2 [Rosa rugosa]
MDICVNFNPISRLILHLLLLLFLASSCLNTSSIMESCMEEERQALLSFKQDLTDSSGKIPSSLGNLTNLNYLDLDSYSLSNVSSKNLNWISHLSSLKYLSLREVNLNNTGVSWLHAVNKLPSLLELHLSSCQIQSIPHSLQSINLTSLAVLDMSLNNVITSSFPKWIFNLSSLTKLDLSDNFFSDPFVDEFATLKSLEHLDLSFTGLKGQVPKFIGSLCKLKSLSLAVNKFDGGIQEFLSGFSDCSFNRMKSLDLSYCGLVGKLPSSLGILKSLQYLTLRGNLFNGSIPQSLGKLTQLVILDLSDNSWDGSLTEAHFINLTRLKSFQVSTDRLVPIIFNLTDYEWIPAFKLREIYIYNCRVGVGFPLWLQSQTELVRVSLTNTGISGPIPEEWVFKISSQIQWL